ILAEGRRSELVREEGFSIDVFLPITLALSRTSSLLRPSGRSLEAFYLEPPGLAYNDERGAWGR
ncbi:hypothetical protein, partial [Pseudomonas syringae]|uniref:hypothetical protein n=1 Tax=Pseudomonas syringae TaxID=317 RepID=UPI001C803957